MLQSCRVIRSLDILANYCQGQNLPEKSLNGSGIRTVVGLPPIDIQKDV